MAYSISIATLVARCQQRANKVGDGQIEQPEWKEMISEYFGRCHKAVSDAGARCFETDAALNLGNLALPSDHYATIGVDYLPSSTSRIELPELMVQERNLFVSSTGQARAWALSGTNLALYPTPTSGTYRHVYVPQPTDYSTASDATAVDVLTIDGLSTIIWGAASVALHRSESLQQRAIDESNAALERLTEWATKRSKTMPKRQVITNIGPGMGSTSDLNGAWNPASWKFNR